MAIATKKAQFSGLATKLIKAEILSEEIATAAFENAQKNVAEFVLSAIFCHLFFAKTLFSSMVILIGTAWPQIFFLQNVVLPWTVLHLA